MFQSWHYRDGQALNVYSSIAVEAGKSNGVLTVPRLSKPVGVKEESESMRAWQRNVQLNKTLDELFPKRAADGDDCLFSDANVVFSEVATPDNVKAAFDYSKKGSPLFPFIKTQNGMYSFFLRAVLARRKVELSVMKPIEPE